MGKFLSRKQKKSDSGPRRRRADAQPDRSSQAELDQKYSFRRNRTLTGSSSARIASGNELNAEIRSPRAHVHHLSSTRRRLWLYFIAVSIVSISVYIFLSQAVASVEIHVARTQVLPVSDQKAYTQAVEDYYAARPAERLRFVLNDADLLSHIQATNPEVKNITISPTGEFGKAEIRITPRTPIARWSINRSDQYVDASGVVFTRNFYSAPSLQIVDNSGVRAGKNQIVTSNRFLGFVGRVVGLARERGLEVSRVTIPSQTTRQIEIRLKSVSQRYKLSIDRSTGEQVEDIARITSYLKRKGISPGYVDVRVQGKAFYK